MDSKMKSAIKKLIPFLKQAQAENLNEADTVMRIIKVFETALGYNTLTEISRETHMKGKYVDIAIKIDGVIRLLIEAKAAGVTLRDRHIEQAEAYASRNNYRWVLLTNGIVWNLYHLTFEEGIEYERVFSVDVTDVPIEKTAELLGLLSKPSLKKGLHEKYWERKSALGAAVVGRCLFHEDVLRLVRREIKRESGVSIDPEDLVAAIHSLLSLEAREQVGPAKLRRKKPLKPSTSKQGLNRPRAAIENVVDGVEGEVGISGNGFGKDGTLAEKQEP